MVNIARKHQDNLGSLIKILLWVSHTGESALLKGIFMADTGTNVRLAHNLGLEKF